jgi:hypothetical protein
MTERTHRTRIDNLTSVGEELTEEHLRLVSGAANKKRAGGGRGDDGTSTGSMTYVTNHDWSQQCENDSDED